MKNKILIIGAGVLGCNIAAHFYDAGKDVTLLARGQWYDELKKNGLRIRDQLSGRMKTRQIPVTDRLLPGDSYDVIFVSLRYTQLDTVLPMLKENATENIIFNGNNMRPEETARKLPGKNVMFSFSLSAGHREKDRVCSLDLKKITVGGLKGNPGNEPLLHRIFENTSYKVVYEPNMGDYLLCHAGFVIPASFACYHTDGNLKKIKRDRAYITKVICANRECYEAIEKTGHEILPDADKEYQSKKYFNTCYLFYKLMCATFLGKVCASDHAMNAVGEMSALAEDMEALLRQSQVPFPVYRELKADLDRYAAGSSVS